MWATMRETKSFIGLSPDGVIQGQCATCLPGEERWPIAGWDQLKGLPWGQKPNTRDLPTEASDPERVIVIQQPQQQQQSQQADPRQFYVTAAHVDDRLYGKTPGCPKCNAIARGAKPHTATTKNAEKGFW